MQEDCLNAQMLRRMKIHGGAPKILFCFLSISLPAYFHKAVIDLQKYLGGLSIACHQMAVG